MRFHLHLLPTYHPDRDAPFDVYYQQVLEQVQLAEELGFETFWCTEHHFLLYGGPVPNPAVFMAAVAARTSKIRLGSSISILPLHHPLQVAEDYAMVDVASGGRLEFGIGMGNTPVDFEHYEVPRDQSRERFEEAAEVVIKAWSKDRFSHHGKHWSMDNVEVYPRPVQQPHPPFWVAGGSPESLGWAGRHGAGIMTVAHPYPPERLIPGMAAWRAGLKEAGHDAASAHCKIHLRVWVDESSEKACETAQAAIVRYDDLMMKGRVAREFAPPDQYDWDGMRAMGRNIYGNPDECIQGIKNTIANYDFDIFSATFNFGGIPHKDVKHAMTLFAREVMPAFR
jgi:alkanesulfonate monooxygenase SsuD/methylene tetrahydromethanopterin reductase-like flavin-dependent oxidoreductase (luciferase family)